MLDMGFQPQVDRILRSVPAKRQTMLFSATLEGAVGALADKYTNDPARFRAELPVEKRSGEIEHEFVAGHHDKKLDRLVEQLEAERGLALVFVRTKHGADKLAKKLSHRDIGAVAMHGNLSQNARERALKRFESGRVSTLVATDVAARGLDVDDITHVINFDPPRADEDYVHRVGRTGRAGRSGTGVTFVLPEQQTDVGKLAGRLGHGAAFAASGMRQTATAPPLAAAAAAASRDDKSASTPAAGLESGRGRSPERRSVLGRTELVAGSHLVEQPQLLTFPLDLRPVTGSQSPDRPLGDDVRRDPGPTTLMR